MNRSHHFVFLLVVVLGGAIVWRCCSSEACIAGPTIRGLQHIDSWIGNTKWDIIHFNCGLWNMYGWEYVEENRSPVMYEKRLEVLANRLEKNWSQTDLGNHHSVISLMSIRN